MRLLPILSKKPRIKHVAIFDIGSGSVGASLVEFDPEGDHPTILWNARSHMSFQEIPHFEQLTKSMLSTLLDSVLELQTEGFQRLKESSQKNVIDDMLFVFSSPWHAMQTKMITLKKEEPFRITRSFLDSLLDKEEKKFTAVAAGSTGDKAKAGPQLMEKQIIQTVLNCYTTAHPYHKMVRHAKIDIILSAVPKDIYEKISEITTQMLNGESGVFHSFTLVSFSVVRDIFHNKEDFLLLDISAEITDVALVGGGALLETASFPQGRRFLVREIASELNTIPEEAATLVRAYFDGHIGAEYYQKIKSSLEKCADSWVHSLDETLIQLSENISIPKTIYISVDGDFGVWFKEIIEKKDFSHLIFSDASFSVILLDSALLGGFVKHGKSVSSVDPFLALSALFFRKIVF